MNIAAILLSIALAGVSAAAIVVILMQSGRSAGLGSLGGGVTGGDTYWSKNKGRSLEGALERITKLSAAGLILFAMGLNIVFTLIVQS